MFLTRIGATTLLVAALAGCAANPVTGRNELQLIPESQEIQIGRENYAPLRQAEGGDLVIEPELTAYVNEVGQRLAAVSDRPQLPYEFVVVNNSVPNAWALPGGKIAINRGLLLEMDSEAELAAVLGHEIVHAAARHGAQRMERGLLMEAGVAAVMIGTQDTRHAGLVGGVAQVGAMLLTQGYSRGAELEADEYGMLYMHRAGYDPQAAVALQETFVGLAEGRQAGWLDGLLASHPPSQERVDANRARAAALGSDGTTMGREQYHARLVALRGNADAYVAFDRGREALSEGRHAEAAEAARLAIRLEPREAQFYGLLGAAEHTRGPRAALPHYDNAIRLNSGYYGFFLQRGLAHQELGNRDAAVRDLQRSNELLPTAAANAALGGVAESLGQRDAAIGYYRQAARANSSDGRHAIQRLAALELGDNARSVIQVTPVLAADGTLALVASNRGSLPARDLALRLSWVDERGRIVQQREITLRGTVPTGGRGMTAGTGIAIGGEDELRSIRVLVLHAGPAL